VPTLAGQDVRRQAERLETEALSLVRDVGGRDTRLAGLVRVTCAETIATHILAPCLASLHTQHPDISPSYSRRRRGAAGGRGVNC
jgi:DNA-binding transcriptional LysR family regulator